MAMCPGPGAPPVGVAPVKLIVSTPAGSRLGPVGDLVPLVAGAAQGLVGLGVAVGHDVVVGARNHALCDLPGQRGALLDDQ